MKKTLKIVAIVVATIIFLFIAFGFAKQCYIKHILNESELEWEDVPRWLVYGGKERYNELYDMGLNHIQKSLERKYANATKIEINNLHVMLTGNQQSIDCIEYQNSEYFYKDIYANLSTQSWLEYSGVVMAECNIDGKDFIAYVDLHSEGWRVYDNYQREEIYAAVTEYFDNLIDTKPLYNLVHIEEYEVSWYRIGVEYTEYYDMAGACHNYFDGDVEKFLTNNDVLNQINITVIYNTNQKLPIDEEFIKGIGQDCVSIYRITDKEIAQKYIDGDIEIYDMWQDIDECYISRGKQERYDLQWLWEYRDYCWSPKEDLQNNTITETTE